MKKVLSFILLGAMLLTLIPMAVFADTASSVENTFDPDKGEYGISTAADLLAFSQALVTKNNAFSGKTVYLNADIDMAGQTTWANCGFGGGTFDGRGHTISNLDIGNLRGMFAWAHGEIKNFTLKDSVIGNNEKSANVGAIVAGNTNNRSANLTISNVHVINTNVSGKGGKVGGLIGNTQGSNAKTEITIENCSFIGGKINSKGADIGGIVGFATGIEKLTVKNCEVSSAEISGTTTTNTKTTSVGGVLGRVNKSIDCTIEACSVCNVTVTANENGCGGLVGQAAPGGDTVSVTLKLLNCYVSGLILDGTGGGHKGGLVGRFGQGAKLEVTNCFASGSNRTTGGLIGWVNTGVSVTLTNVYSSMQPLNETQKFAPILYVNTGSPVFTFTNVYASEKMDVSNGIIFNGSSNSADTSKFTKVSNKTVEQVLSDLSGSAEETDTAMVGMLSSVLKKSVFSVGWQNKGNGNGTYDYRLIFGLRNKDAVDPAVLGSIVKINNGEAQKVDCKYAYTSLLGTNANDTVETYQASDYGADYLFVIVIHDVPETVESFDVELTPYIGYSEDKLYCSDQETVTVKKTE